MTNTYLDLRPVVFAAARKLGLSAVFLHSEGDGRVTSTADWILVSGGGTLFELQSARTGIRHRQWRCVSHTKAFPPWTDNYSNLIRIIRH